MHPSENMLMKKEIYLHIPTPCHEDWNKMTPVEKGRFCESCAKRVIDFTTMADREILHHLANSSRLCGRFNRDQLERALTQPKEQKKKVWWMTMLMPALLLFEKSDAQRKISVKPEIVSRDTVTNVISEKLRGAVSCYFVAAKFSGKLIITGKVSDNENRAVFGAMVMIKNSHEGTVTDTSGNFKLEIDKAQITKPGTVVFSAIGYETKEVSIPESDSNLISLNQTIVLNPALTGEVVVVGGLVSCYRKPKKIDTVATKIRKIIKLETFNVYPNPVQRGQEIKIDVKKAGEYSIQILDTQSKLIAASYFDAIKGSTTTSLTIPSTTAAGMYYIRVIDEKKQKQYTDTLIIQ